MGLMREVPMLLRAAALLALLAAVSPAAGAQDLTACSPEHAGERLCRAGNVCVCRLTGGTMLGIPIAYRWDCQIGNGGCIEGEYNPLSRLPYTPMPTQAVRPRPSVSPEPGPERAQIVELQKALSRHGFDPGPADGVFGPRTRAALNAFQRRERLPVTDRPSPEALARLRG
jgi:hypothetical protein